MRVGEQIWWWHTAGHRRRGVVWELGDEQVGVTLDEDGSTLYLAPDQLHSEPLPDGIYRCFDYHPEPHRLSPNGAKKLLVAPAKFDYERRHPSKPKAEFDFGKLVHLLVLGEGEQVAPIHAADYRTKAAQDQRDKARAEGLIPALPHEMDAAKQMADVVRQHPDAGPLLAQGDAEMWLYATDPDTDQPIRLRTDWMAYRDRLWICEYKTAADANPKLFGRKAYDYGYHLQMVFAVVAARALELDESPAFVFFVQEKDPPYLVSVNELDADAYQVGRADMTRAIRIFQECARTGIWPGYPGGINPISLPAWAFSRPSIGELLEDSA